MLLLGRNTAVGSPSRLIVCPQPVQRCGTDDRKHFTVAVTVGNLWVVALAMFWQYEQPGRLRTIAALVTAFCLGVVIIQAAQRRGLISLRTRWVVAFLLKITLSFLITEYAWVAPLQPDLLRVPDQAAALQDSNVYDYNAKYIADNGGENFTDRAYFTWLSFGVIAYLAAIYGLFGVSVLYVSSFNAVLSLLGVLCLVGAMSTLSGTRRPWEVLRFAMLIPLGAYYDATPSKEPLTHALFYCALYFTVKLLVRTKYSLPDITLLVLAVGGLALVRVNAAALFIAANVPFLLRRIRLGRSVITVASLGLSLMAALFVVTPDPKSVVDQMFSLEGHISASQSLYADRANTAQSSMKLAVGRLLLPSSVFDVVLLSPLRALVWALSPYPSIWPDFQTIARMPTMLELDRLGYAGFASEILAQGSAILLIIVSPYVLSALIQKAGRWTTPLFLKVNLLLPAFVISNLMFIMGRRYRCLIEPLLVAMGIWGARQRNRNCYRLPVYAALLFGALVSWIYGLCAGIR